MNYRIAILTQPLHINFGGTLQAYALQKIFEKKGYYVETINYRKKQKNDIYLKLSSFKNLILLKKNYHFTAKEYNYIKSQHQDFINKQINYSKEINDVNYLKQYIESNDFDAIVVGSDQVWRVEYSPRIETFFLDFIDNVNINKIVYAASFGVDEWQFSPKQTIELKDLLLKFKYVSVRESSAVLNCKNYWNIDVDLVLDPTLLLEPCYYLEILNKQNRLTYNNIFTYILDDSIKKQDIISKFASILDKKVHGITIMNKKNFFDKDISKYLVPSIEDWITNIYNSDFVITDSFHGMVFSIIFNKKFIVIPNHERGKGRFYSLLNFLNLQDRIYNEHVDINYLVNNEINYEVVNKIISEKRNEIMNKLFLILENSND